MALTLRMCVVGRSKPRTSATSSPSCSSPPALELAPSSRSPRRPPLAARRPRRRRARSPRATPPCPSARAGPDGVGDLRERQRRVLGRGQLRHRGVHRVEPDQLAPVRSAFARRCSMAGGMWALRLAPPPLEELREPLLHPHRRPIVGELRDRVVDQLVIDGVQPGIPLQRARGEVTMNRAHLHSAMVPVRSTSSSDSDDTAARLLGLLSNSTRTGSLPPKPRSTPAPRRPTRAPRARRAPRRRPRADSGR